MLTMIKEGKNQVIQACENTSQPEERKRNFCDYRNQVMQSFPTDTNQKH